MLQVEVELLFFGATSDTVSLLTQRRLMLVCVMHNLVESPSYSKRVDTNEGNGCLAGRRRSGQIRQSGDG